MILTYVTYPVGSNLDEKREELLKFCDTLTPEEIEGIHEDVFHEEYIEDGDDIIETRRHYRIVVVKAFEAFGGRQVAQLRIHDTMVYATGGLSGGDSASDVYDDIEGLYYILELWREKRWQRLNEWANQ